MQNNEMLDYALRYLNEFEWSVVPIQPRGKRPLIEWEEYKRRRPTESEIRTWWQEWPEANVGVVTGSVSNLVVMDFTASARDLARQLHERHSTGLIAKSGSGGFHLFYAHPGTQVGNRVNRQAGLDVRADGGVIVLPPSIHQTGSRYEWISNRNLGFIPDPLATFEELTARHSSENGVVPDGHDDRWLATVLDGVGHGERNDACARLAGYFAGKNMPKEVVFTLLHQWNSKNRPPLPIHEIQTTVDSVFRTMYRNRQQTVPTPGSPSTNSFETVDFRTYMSTFGDEEVKWDVEDWLPERTIALLVAQPGSYKTWLLLDLAVSFAGGRPFLGQIPVSSTGPVLVVQQEDYNGQTAQRLATIIASSYGFQAKDDGDDFQVVLPPDLPIHFHVARALRFDNPQVVEALYRRIAEVRPKLVVIDPLYSAASVEDYMAKAADQMGILKRMRDEFGCSFAIAHHTKKRADSTAREEAWGSQFINAFLETGWQIRSTDIANTILVRRHFKAHPVVPEVTLTFNIDTNEPRYSVAVVAPDGTQRDILQVLQTRGSLTVTEIARLSGMNHGTASRRLQRYMASGMVTRGSDGRYSIGRLPDF